MPQLDILYTWVKKYTADKGTHIPLSEVNSIITAIAGIPREQLLLEKNIRITDAGFKRIKYVVRKRLSHYPLQYLLGSAEFMGINFLIKPGILIPRPETELLVETALKIIEGHTYSTILDLCCGSGVIGLSIARTNKSARVSLSDISRRAISLAKENCRRLGLASRAKFYTGDLFSPLPASARFDLIVSNPPYVPQRRIRYLQKEVLYEPLEAIDGGVDGLGVIRRITGNAGKFLKKNGVLIIEHDDTHESYFHRFNETGFKNTLRFRKTIKDLAALPRISIFDLPENVI